MELEKKNIEAIKYRLEKLDIKATNGDIRVAALDFETLDIDAIADKVVHNIKFKSSQLVAQSTKLTENTKHSLVKIEAEQLNIQLSDLEVSQVIEATDSDISDSAQFIIGVREFLRDFIYQKNQELASQNRGLIGTVQQVINEGNQEKARIVAETNQSLIDAISVLKRGDDYKSPYTSRLESLREMFQAKANS